MDTLTTWILEQIEFSELPNEHCRPSKFEIYHWRLGGVVKSVCVNKSVSPKVEVEIQNKIDYL